MKPLATMKVALTENQSKLSELLKKEITDISIAKHSGGPTDLIIEELARRLDAQGVKVSE